jgi:predicted lipoprotein with Yx(FWY)xxD motif
MGRHRLVAVTALPLILIVAACTGGGATPTPAAASAAPSAAPSAAASEAASPAEAASPGQSESAETYEVKVATGTVGGAQVSFLTGEDGKTLYVFAKDTANAGTSACGAGACADNWPAFTVDDKDQLKAGSGVTGTLDVFTRADGKLQVTYKGLPLYYFAGDTKAGDTNGSAIKNWGVATP